MHTSFRVFEIIVFIYPYILTWTKTIMARFWFQKKKIGMGAFGAIQGSLLSYSTVSKNSIWFLMIQNGIHTNMHLNKLKFFLTNSILIWLKLNSQLIKSRVRKRDFIDWLKCYVITILMKNDSLLNKCLILFVLFYFLRAHATVNAWSNYWKIQQSKRSVLKSNNNVTRWQRNK